MKPGSLSPLDARGRFKSRTTGAAIVFGVGCISLVTLVSWPLSEIFPNFLVMVLADAIIIAILYYFYTWFQAQGVHFQCPSCGKVLSSTTAWVCGLCGKTNLHPKTFPVVNECEHCPNEPKAYKCHHCRKPIFFSQDEDRAHMSYRLDASIKEPEPKPDADAETAKQYERVKRKKQHEVEIAKLDREKRECEKEDAVPKVKTEHEKKIEELRNQLNGQVGLRQEFRRMRAEAPTRHPNDPKALQDELDAIDALEREHLE